MENARIIGRNMQLIANEKNISNSDLASQVGISEIVLNKLFDGRAALVPKTVLRICKVLNVDFDELTRKRDESEYKRLIHCMSDFDKMENCDKIMDIIDAYCDLVSATM